VGRGEGSHENYFIPGAERVEFRPTDVIVGKGGTMLATTGEQGLLLVTRSRANVQRLGAFTVQAALSPDGKRVATASSQRVDVWGVSHPLGAGNMPVCVRCRPRIFVGQQDGGGDHLRDDGLHRSRDEWCGGRRFRPTAPRLLSTVRGDRLLFVDSAGKEAFELDPAWSRGGKLAVSANDYSASSDVQVWDLAAKRELARLGDATAAAFLRSDSMLVLTAPDLSLRTLDGRRVGSLVALAGADAGYALSGDGPTFVEVIGDESAARAAPGRRLGDVTYLFEVCSDTFEP